jgi:hypothetical protein
MMRYAPVNSIAKKLITVKTQLMPFGI